MCSTHTPRQKFQSNLSPTHPTTKKSPKYPKLVRYRVRQNPHFKPKITPSQTKKSTQISQNHLSNIIQTPINQHFSRTQSFPYYNVFKINHLTHLDSTSKNSQKSHKQSHFANPIKTQIYFPLLSLPNHVIQTTKIFISNFKSPISFALHIQSHFENI